jgi:hypothetical protein
MESIYLTGEQLLEKGKLTEVNGYKVNVPCDMRVEHEDQGYTLNIEFLRPTLMDGNIRCIYSYDKMRGNTLLVSRRYGKEHEGPFTASNVLDVIVEIISEMHANSRVYGCPRAADINAPEMLKDIAAYERIASVRRIEFELFQTRRTKGESDGTDNAG